MRPSQFVISGDFNMRLKVLSSLAAIAVALPTMAHEPENPAEARIAYYKLVSAEMHVLADMAGGKSEYDADVAAQSAKDLMTLASLNLADYFAPGTSNEDLPGKTRAKADIWENFEDFGSKGMAYFEAVVAINAVAGDGLEALQPAVAQLGGTCSACHKAYRARSF